MCKGLLITTIFFGRMIVVDPVRPKAASYWLSGHRDCGGGSGHGGGDSGRDGGGRDGSRDCGEACRGGWDCRGGSTNIEVLPHCSIGSAELPVAEDTILGHVKNLPFIWMAFDF